MENVIFFMPSCSTAHTRTHTARTHTISEPYKYSIGAIVGPLRPKFVCLLVLFCLFVAFSMSLLSFFLLSRSSPVVVLLRSSIESYVLLNAESETIHNWPFFPVRYSHNVFHFFAHFSFGAVRAPQRVCCRQLK